jgi:hypothetical protein
VAGPGGHDTAPGTDERHRDGLRIRGGSEAAIRRAEAAHREHEARGGASEDWPAWYAAYMVAEQAGAPLPT